MGMSNGGRTVLAALRTTLRHPEPFVAEQVRGLPRNGRPPKCQVDKAGARDGRTDHIARSPHPGDGPSDDVRQAHKLIAQDRRPRKMLRDRDRECRGGRDQSEQGNGERQADDGHASWIHGLMLC